MSSRLAARDSSVSTKVRREQLLVAFVARVSVYINETKSVFREEHHSWFFYGLRLHDRKYRVLHWIPDEIALLRIYRQ